MYDPRNIIQWLNNKNNVSNISARPSTFMVNLQVDLCIWIDVYVRTYICYNLKEYAQFTALLLWIIYSFMMTIIVMCAASMLKYTIELSRLPRIWFLWCWTLTWHVNNKCMFNASVCIISEYKWSNCLSTRTKFQDLLFLFDDLILYDLWLVSDEPLPLLITDNPVSNHLHHLLKRNFELKLQQFCWTD